MSEKPALLQRAWRSLVHNPDYKNFTLENPDRVISGKTVAEILTGRKPTASGKDVDESVALTHSAVWACVRAYSNPFSYFPLHIYRPTDKGREKVSHPLGDVFLRPLPYMNRNVMFERAAIHYILWGNAYIEPIRKSRAAPITGFYTHHPSNVEVIERGVGLNRKILYKVKEAGAKNDTGEFRYLSPDRIIHVANLGDDVVGVGVISKAREDIGLEIARREYGADYFSRGGKFDGILSTKKRLSEEQFNELKDKHQRARDDGGTLITDIEVDYEPLTIPPEDSQFLETGMFSVTTIARWFGVPPWKIQDLQHGSTFRNIEEMGIAFLKDSLAPMVEKFEIEINTKLAGDLDGHYVQFDMESYLRADAVALAEQNRTGIQNGYKLINEVRERNGDNPIEGGDVAVIQTNMIPINMLEEFYNSEKGQNMIAMALADKLYENKK